MELNSIYLDENIINIIYNKLEINSKIKFAYINKFTYTNYKCINKTLIYNYIYTDYILFKKLLIFFNYNEKELLLIGRTCLENIPKIAEKKTGSFQTNGINNNKLNYYYDLRYFFELIMNNISIKELIKSNDINDEIKFMLNKIFKYRYLSRFETLWKISSEPSLRTLNWNFNPCDKDINWIKISTGLRCQLD